MCRHAKSSLKGGREINYPKRKVLHAFYDLIPGGDTSKGRKFQGKEVGGRKRGSGGRKKLWTSSQYLWKEERKGEHEHTTQTEAGSSDTNRE